MAFNFSKYSRLGFLYLCRGVSKPSSPEAEAHRGLFSSSKAKSGALASSPRDLPGPCVTDYSFSFSSEFFDLWLWLTRKVSTGLDCGKPFLEELFCLMTFGRAKSANSLYTSSSSLINCSSFHHSVNGF